MSFKKKALAEGKLETTIKLALGKINVMIKFNKQLDKLGTETAFSVSAEAQLWKDKGHTVSPISSWRFQIYKLSLNIREKPSFT